jgi:hypothetical protein
LRRSDGDNGVGGAGDAPTLVDVERLISALDAKVDELVVEYATLSDLEADARAAWEGHLDRVIVLMADSGERSSEDVRRARAKDSIAVSGESGHDVYKTHLLMKAALDSCGKALYATQTRLSVQQSLLKHLRTVAGFND